MTRISNVDSFKTVDGFIQALKTATVKKKTFGGYTVSLKVDVKGENKIIKVSRNQLAKLALKLAITTEEEVGQFLDLKQALDELNIKGKGGGGRVTKFKQKVGNAFFKMRHGADRATKLKNRAEELDPNERDMPRGTINDGDIL
ncbi:MAG: hypothetical protein ACK5MA_05985 [Parachlamydiaceae bacterium]